MRSMLPPAILLPALLAPPAAAEDGLLHERLGAPDALRIEGSVRARLEGIDGHFRPAPAPDSDALLLLRTTLLAEYDSGPVLIGGEIIDARAYAQGDGRLVTTTEVNALELSQAYLGFDLGGALGAGSTTSLTAGRFTQDIGSRRLVARNAFRNTINAFTGVRLDWQDAAKNSLRAFWTMPHYRLPDDAAGIADNAVRWDRESPDLRFFGASFVKSGVLGGTLEFYGYGLAERDGGRFLTRNRRLFTPGLRFHARPAAGKFDHDVEFAYQTGHARATTAASDVADLPVRAWFLHAEAGRSVDAAWSPRVSLLYDHGSGDGRGRRYTRFDTLFGARRWEYGPTSLYGALQRSNMISPGVRLEVAPDTRWDGFLLYRAAWLDKAGDSFATTSVRDARGASGRFAGHQIELRVRYWLIPKLAQIDSGATLLLKGRFLRDAPNAPDAGDTRYGYTSVTFSF